MLQPIEFQCFLLEEPSSVLLLGLLNCILMLGAMLGLSLPVVIHHHHHHDYKENEPPSWVQEVYGQKDAGKYSTAKDVHNQDQDQKPIKVSLRFESRDKSENSGRQDMPILIDDGFEPKWKKYHYPEDEHKTGGKTLEDQYIHV